MTTKTQLTPDKQTGESTQSQLSAETVESILRGLYATQPDEAIRGCGNLAGHVLYEDPGNDEMLIDIAALLRRMAAVLESCAEDPSYVSILV